MPARNRAVSSSAPARANGEARIRTRKGKNRFMNCLRRTYRFGFRRKKIDDQSEGHRCESQQGWTAGGRVGEEMFQHPEADCEKDDRGNRVAPRPIGAGKFGLSPAQDKDPQHGERGTESEAKFD